MLRNAQTFKNNVNLKTGHSIAETNLLSKFGLVFTLIKGKIKKRKDELNYIDEFLITKNSNKIEQDVELSILLGFKMSQLTWYR